MGTLSLSVDLDSTNLTGGSYNGYVYTVDSLMYAGDSSDYGDGSGSWRLLIDGNDTDDLSPTITAADLKTAIEGLPAVGAGNVAIYELGEGQGFKFGGGFVIEFVGDLSNQATGFTITTSKSVGSTLNLQVWTGYTGSSGTGEVQTLSISGGPVSGTFGLRYGGYDTNLLDYNSTAAEIESALEGLPSIGVGNASCSGGVLPGSDVVITFAAALMGQNQDEIEVIFGITSESVTGSGFPYIQINTTQTKITSTTVTANAGPNDWNTAANWDTNTVPGNNADVTIYDGDDIYYGLDQSAVALNRLEIHQFQTQIGLPRRNDSYYEYKDRLLKINAAEIIIGLGDNGASSDRINLEIVAGSNPLIEVHDSGTGEDGESAVQITGPNVANTAELLVLGGEVGVGVLPKQSGYFKKITQRGGELRTGSDVTVEELISTPDGEFISDRTTIGGEATI